MSHQDSTRHGRGRAGKRHRPAGRQPVPREGGVRRPRDRLAGFETAKPVEFVAELPKTATGKIRKYQLAQDKGEYWRE